MIKIKLKQDKYVLVNVNDIRVIEQDGDNLTMYINNHLYTYNLDESIDDINIKIKDDKD